MELRIRFEFDDTVFGQGFELVNPPVIPSTGEIVDFDWKSFLSDKVQVERIEASQENHSFIGQVLSKKYYPEKVEVLVILHTDDSPEIQRLTGK